MNAMSSEDLSRAQLELFHHSLGFVKSMALKCAVDLGIPTAIHRHGGCATLPEIVAGTGVHASRTPHLRRLMNLLTASGVFASSAAGNGGEAAVAVAYQLTPASRLLVDGDDELGSSSSMAPLIRFLVNPLTVPTFFDMHAWLKAAADDAGAGGSGSSSATTFFEMAHGCSVYEMARRNADHNALYNGAMVAASRVTMEMMLREGGVGGSGIFGGLSSLVDVGGGHGAASVAVAAAFPHVKCSILDLPHVVGQARAPDDAVAVEFVAGDMFDFIPKAAAVLLKWVLHCWGDDDCVKVLRKCKEAIPASGGKVIIIDAVMGAGGTASASNKETQALYDVHMMHIDGVERDERGWEKIILEAGFSGYKVVSSVGIHSVIEVYP